MLGVRNGDYRYRAVRFVSSKPFLPTIQQLSNRSLQLPSHGYQYSRYTLRLLELWKNCSLPPLQERPRSLSPVNFERWLSTTTWKVQFVRESLMKLRQWSSKPTPTNKLLQDSPASRLCWNPLSDLTPALLNCIKLSGIKKVAVADRGTSRQPFR